MELPVILEVGGNAEVLVVTAYEIVTFEAAVVAAITTNRPI